MTYVENNIQCLFLGDVVFLGFNNGAATPGNNNGEAIAAAHEDDAVVHEN